MQREDYYPIYGHQQIPNFVEIIKKPQNVSELLRIIADYIDKGVKLESLTNELEETKIIKKIAIDIIKKNGLSDEFQEECVNQIKLGIDWR